MISFGRMFSLVVEVLLLSIVLNYVILLFLVILVRCSEDLFNGVKMIVLMLFVFDSFRVVCRFVIV